MSIELSESLPTTYAENTAFTTFMVGVLLNSPLIHHEHMVVFNNLNIRQKYGNQFQHSLNLFSQQRPKDQINILHKLQW